MTTAAPSSILIPPRMRIHTYPVPGTPQISSTCQSTVPARAGVTSNSGRGGSSSSPSKVSKLYVYRDGGGKTKLKPAAGTASPPTSSAAVGGFNIVHNILDDVPSGSRYYRDQEPFLSTAKPATANTVRLSRAAARAAPRSRFSKYDAVLAADGGGGGGVGGGGFCGFNKALRHGSPRGVVDVVSPFSAHDAGAEGGGGGGNGMVGSLHSSSRAGDGYIVVNGAGYPSCPTASSGLEALQTPTHGHHRPMDSPDVKAYNRRQLERSRYTMDEPVWDMRKSAVFTGWLIPRSSAPSRPAMPKSSKVSSALLSPEARGSTNMPHHSPLVVSNRFVNGCSTTADLPPPTARPRDCYLPPSDRFRKKPRTSLTTITGATMGPPPSVDGPTVAIEAPSSNIEGHFSSSSRRTERQHFGTAAEGPTGSFDNGVSMAASAAACSLAAGGSPEKRSQPLRSFPASVSLAELKSLRLAFGSALTKEAWLLGTSNLLDAELDLD